jgi:hypothetical protein
MEGGTTGFAVEAVGEALTYRWMRNGVELSGADARYAGVGSAQLEVRGVAVLDEGTYTVAVGMEGGTYEAVSRGAVLAVRQRPQIGAEQQPESQYGLNVGGTAILSVGVQTSEGDTSFQWWYKRNLEDAVALPVPGGASQTVRLTSLDEADDGWYYVEVRNGAGATVSAPARVQVNDPAVIRGMSAYAVSGNPGGTVRVEVQASGDGLDYQWYRMVRGVDIALEGRTSPVLELVNVTEADEGDYRVKVSSDLLVNGPNGPERSALKSAPVRVTVNDPVGFAGVVVRRDTVARAGEALVLTAAATGTAPRFQWYRNAEVIA